jgi:hypothetical protein
MVMKMSGGLDPREGPETQRNPATPRRDPTYWRYPLWALPIAIAVGCLDQMLRMFVIFNAEERYHDNRALASQVGQNYLLGAVVAITCYATMFLIPPNRKLRPIRLLLLAVTMLAATWPAIYVSTHTATHHVTR